MTDQEAEQIMRQLGQAQKSVHNFLDNVAQTKDTTKTGNLGELELGSPDLPVRTYKELALFCNDIGDMNSFGEYFNKMAEIQTSTSLSKEGFLIKAAITTKKELADVTPERKQNKGWFKKKESPGAAQVIE